MWKRGRILILNFHDGQLTCRETSDHSILEGFPTVQVFSILPTEVFGRHVVQAWMRPSLRISVSTVSLGLIPVAVGNEMW